MFWFCRFTELIESVSQVISRCEAYYYIMYFTRKNFDINNLYVWRYFWSPISQIVFVLLLSNKLLIGVYFFDYKKYICEILFS